MIHPTAIIEPGAHVAEDVSIGPFCYVGPGVSVGSGTVLHNSVTLLGRTTIGKRNTFHSFCVIGGDPQDFKYQGEDSQTIIGDHNILRENCTVNKGTAVAGNVTRIGSHNYLMACSHIAHDTMIENHCILANACLLGGHIKIEEWAILSGVVAVHHFVTIGKHAFVGGVTRVSQDVPPFMIMQGFAGEVRGVNSVGLRRRNFTSSAINALRESYRRIWRSGSPKSDALVHVEQEFGSIPEVRVLVEFLRASDRGRLGRAREVDRLSPVAPESGAELLE